MRNVMLVGVALLIVTCSPAVASAATVDLPDGAKLDLSVPCPVCNMKPEASKLGPAAAVFKDNKVVGFDSTDDFFRYFLSPDKYKFDTANIKDMYVTEYGTKNFLDAKKAFYVVGAEVADTMGPAVAPFSKKEDAEKFKTERKGAKVVSFEGIKLADLEGKKKMLKMHGH